MSHDDKFYSMNGIDFRKSRIVAVGPVRNPYQTTNFGFNVWVNDSGSDPFWIDYPNVDGKAEESKAMAIAQRAALMEALEDAS